MFWYQFVGLGLSPSRVASRSDFYCVEGRGRRPGWAVGPPGAVCGETCKVTRQEVSPSFPSVSRTTMTVTVLYKLVVLPPITPIMLTTADRFS